MTLSWRSSLMGLIPISPPLRRLTRWLKRLRPWGIATRRSRPHWMLLLLSETRPRRSLKISRQRLMGPRRSTKLLATSWGRPKPSFRRPGRNGWPNGSFLPMDLTIWVGYLQPLTALGLGRRRSVSGPSRLNPTPSWTRTRWTPNLTTVLPQNRGLVGGFRPQVLLAFKALRSSPLLLRPRSLRQGSLLIPRRWQMLGTRLKVRALAQPNWRLLRRKWGIVMREPLLRTLLLDLLYLA